MLEDAEIERLNLAYRRALRLLHLVDRNDPIGEIIAMKVIEVGKLGVRDPRKISAIAVKQLSWGDKLPSQIQPASLLGAKAKFWRLLKNVAQHRTHGTRG
jgi:hypothetical protein